MSAITYFDGKSIIFAETFQKFPMKRIGYIVMFLLGLGFFGSCGGRNASSETDGNDTLQQAPLMDSIMISSLQDLENQKTDTMLMVVDSRGRVIGRYMRTNADSYTIFVQDMTEVPIVGNKVVTFRAKDGKGILYTRRTHVNIRQEPNTTSAVLTQITTPNGKVPQTYPCLGKEGEWYKIIVKGMEGYVREDLVIWDGMSSF